MTIIFVGARMAAERRRPRVVIVGGGFGGLRTAKSLARASADITLIDRRNFHLFQPLLYQVATGGLSPANIAAPIRSLFRRQKNCHVLLGNVIDFDLGSREVILEDGRIPFDVLVVSAGAKHSYFGHDEWEPHAPGLKTLEDATEIRGRILSAFERAERSDSSEERARHLRFVVIGGGPTGVELAGTLIEIARHTLRKDFRRINPTEAQVLLIEAGPRVLSAFDEDLSTRAAESLRSLGVDLRLQHLVTGISRQGVDVRCGERVESIAAATVLWAAGVQGESIGLQLARSTGAECDRAGRILVTPDFSLPGHPDIFVIGDLAAYRTTSGQLLPVWRPRQCRRECSLRSSLRHESENCPLPGSNSGIPVAWRPSAAAPPW